jgi:hypothetical protein
MSDKDRQACFESLPDMLDGFLKKWGWLHFAQAVEQTRDKQWSPIIESLQSERAALKKANETFEKQQKWWNERMFRLEQELERVKGQEPVAWQIRIGDSPDWGWSDTESDADFYGKQSGLRYEKRPLYTTPPAQPATIEYVDAREKDPARIATVFANAFNAPLVQPAQEPLFWYRPCAGGMYEGPVHHKSIGGKMMRDQKPSEWKPLYTTPPAQPAQPEQTCSACGDVLVGDKLDGALCCDCAYRPAEQGWMRVIDEEMVGAHLGVAHPADSYDEAKQKLKSLICWHVSVATNSAPTENKP